MKNSLIYFAIVTLFLLSSCKDQATESIYVSSNNELYSALKNAQAGNQIVMANGVWKDVEIRFIANGTAEQPITLTAETAGKVFIEGKSDLKFGGEHLTVSGMYFRNGYTPSSTVVEFWINKDTIANHCRFTNSVIENYNQPKRDHDDLWVQFHGKYNKMDRCYLAGKANRGPTVRVDIKGNESITNYHEIVNNHFGPRPRKGGPSGETIQLGDSYTSMSPSHTMVANNLFEECNGEVEVISSKTNFNVFKNNVFYKSEGSLVTRHGNYSMIDGNYFIGDSENENIGGIRIINTGHWVVNNYFFNLKGKSFRSPLAVMNGIPKSPLNRYNQVTDVVVAYNTYVNCSSPWQFGVGTNVAQADVLPTSEIRSARAIRTIVANNIVYNEKGLDQIVVENDKADGVAFKNNIVDNKGVAFKDFDGGIIATALELKKVSDNIMLPTGIPIDIEAYNGFDFNTIENDLFGASRKGNNSIGAVVDVNVSNPNILDKTKYGASWHSNVPVQKELISHKVTNSTELVSMLVTAKEGDTLTLAQGVYELRQPLVINKKINIVSAKDMSVIIKYKGPAATPVFEMHPKGDLTVNNLKINGDKTQMVFASLKENMFSHYNLSVLNTEIQNFDYVLKAYKETFAEEISFKNTIIKNCANGIELSEETNDKGDYNVEFLTIDNCHFTNVSKNVIDYYRGGYDESTIGGNLHISNSTFDQCGAMEANGILLNTRGIVNVQIANNTFSNNQVKLVALLWGAKNNTHSNNIIKNSGEIRVEENLKMKLMY